MAASSLKNQDHSACTPVPASKAATVAAIPPPIIMLDRRGNPVCETMTSAELAEVAQATRTPFFGIPRWNRKRQWQRMAPLIAKHGWQGITLVDARVNDVLPPPFAENFEPIELNVRDPAEKTLLRGTKLRTTLRTKLLTAWLVILGSAMIIGIGLQLWLAPSRVRTLGLLAATILPVPLLVVTARVYRMRRSRWFLVPAGVVIADGLQPGKQCARYLKRAETMAAYIGFGRGRYRRWHFLELWLPNERIYHVVQRADALAFIAAWRSPLAPPNEAQLSELTA